VSAGPSLAGQAPAGIAAVLGAWSLIAWRSRSCTIAILVLTSQIALSTSAVAQAAAEI
jgi:hypothetical protein